MATADVRFVSGPEKETERDEYGNEVRPVYGAKMPCRPDAELRPLADQLGVSTDSLRALGCRCGEDGEYQNPQRDHHSRIIGWAVRTLDGLKRFATGQSVGLAYADDWYAYADTQPLVIVEGASDAAALRDMGLSAIGRPSNLHTKYVAELLIDAFGAQVLDPGREIVILAERDQKPDGRWPGMEGARAIYRRLRKMLGAGHPIRILLPPRGAKDARDYRRKLRADELAGAAARLLSDCEPVTPPDAYAPTGHAAGCHCGSCVERIEESERESKRSGCGPFMAVYKDGILMHAKLYCRRWSCSRCRNDLAKKWTKHFGRLMAELHQSGCDKIYRYTISQADRERMSTAVRRAGGNYFAVTDAAGRVTVYATTLPKFAAGDAITLTPDDAAGDMADRLKSLQVGQRPISCSTKWKLEKPAPEGWLLVPGSWQNREAVMQAAHEFRLSMNWGSSEFFDDVLDVGEFGNGPDYSFFAGRFADRVREIAYGHRPDYIHGSAAEWWKCRRETIRASRYIDSHRQTGVDDSPAERPELHQSARY